MKYLCCLCLILVGACYGAQLDQILDKVDRLYRSKTSTSEVQMNITTPNWKRSLIMSIATKGMDYTFVVIKSPRKDKGIATLKRDNEMWNFFPKINKVMKVPPSMMMSSWMGSDFTNDDLVKENTMRDDYHAKLNSDTGAEYKITLTPKKSTVSVWGKIELYVDQKTMTPTKQLYFDEKNIKVRTIQFGKLKKIDGRMIPLEMVLTPHTKSKQGHSTVITYLNIKFNPKIPDSTFTRRNLQKRR